MTNSERQAYIVPLVKEACKLKRKNRYIPIILINEDKIWYDKSGTLYFELKVKLEVYKYKLWMPSIDKSIILAELPYLDTLMPISKWEKCKERLPENKFFALCLAGWIKGVLEYWF